LRVKTIATVQKTPEAANADPRWHAATLLRAPHRLAFFLAMVVLAVASLWWACVQLDRAGLGLALPYAVPPSLTHSAVMTFGFFPLFFSGFLFTAGPKWLAVRGPNARDIRPPLLCAAMGWLLWLLAGHVGASLAALALLLALAGLGAITVRFWRLVLASQAPDRVHAKVVAAALAAGCASLASLCGALLLDRQAFARACILTGLWSFVVVVFAAVAHRMIPFFTSSALPMGASRPFWVLWWMLSVAGFEAVAVWMEFLGAPGSVWPCVRGMVELVLAGVLAWLAIAWGRVQRLKVRLLAMLHAGFLWLGLGLALSGLSQLALAFTGAVVLPLAALHAVTMGGLGSLMLAMVTRVSCGQSGRAQVADNRVWLMFWLLQAAVLLRIAAALPLAPAQLFLATAAVLWAAVMLAWGLRYASWYGRARVDGRPG
jgi:uncharacterized protein involved in response to NO